MYDDDVHQIESDPFSEEARAVSVGKNAIDRCPGMVSMPYAVVIMTLVYYLMYASLPPALITAGILAAGTDPLYDEMKSPHVMPISATADTGSGESITRASTPNGLPIESNPPREAQAALIDPAGRNAAIYASLSPALMMVGIAAGAGLFYKMKSPHVMPMAKAYTGSGESIIRADTTDGPPTESGPLKRVQIVAFDSADKNAGMISMSHAVFIIILVYHAMYTSPSRALMMAGISAAGAGVFYGDEMGLPYIVSMTKAESDAGLDAYDSVPRPLGVISATLAKQLRDISDSTSSAIDTPCPSSENGAFATNGRPVRALCTSNTDSEDPNVIDGNADVVSSDAFPILHRSQELNMPHVDRSLQVIKGTEEDVDANLSAE